MNPLRRIAKNTFVLLISQFVGLGLGFFFTLYTARYLGAEGYGALAFAISFAGLFAVFADLGLNQLTTREVARDRSLASKYLGNLLVIKTLLIALTFVLIALAINVLNYPAEVVTVVYLVGLSVAIGSFNDTFNSLFQAFEKMEYQSIGAILNSILMLAGALVCITQHFGVIAFGAVYLIVSIIVLVYSIAVTGKRFVVPKIEADQVFWKSNIKEALPFGVSGVFVTIYFTIDSVLLSFIVGNSAVGWYNAAYKLIFVLMAVPSVFLISMFPVMSRHYDQATVLKQEFSLAFKYLFITACFILIYGYLFANQIIAIIYGNEFLPSILALQILIFVVPLMFLTYLFGVFLQSTNKQRVVTAITGINCVFNVVLNIVLIPRFGFIGASVVTVLTEGLGFILLLTFIFKNVVKIPLVNYLLKPALVTGITIFITYFVALQSWLLAGIVALSLYCGGLLLVGAISQEDVKLIKQLVKSQ